MQSDTFRYINLAELALVLVGLRGQMHLCPCVRKERGDGEGAGVHVTMLSDVIYSIGPTGCVASACGSEEKGSQAHALSLLSDTHRRDVAGACINRRTDVRRTLMSAVSRHCCL